MRSRFRLALTVMLLLVPAFLSAQRARVSVARAEDVLKELAKTTYTARRDLPASENIFVENGKVMEEMFLLTRQEHPTAVPAGKAATVAKVILMDRAIQVLFRERCGIIIILQENQDAQSMTLPQVIEAARTGLNAVFQVYGTEQKPKLPT